MGSAYDRKFAEMKGYIPFLDDMISRLESTSNASFNPRQAQLDKIRSLRDLLLDEKKRMKMENLLKCEQVLINLYAKVEQNPSGYSGKKPTLETAATRKEKPDLETVRNKLKAVTKLRDVDDTLPEIARASQIEEVCTPGSKEPALFQRRPNKASMSPHRDPIPSQDKPKVATTTKRNYTRVLLSPEPSVRRRPSEGPTEESLFSRRSPRRSPRRHSPTYHKKERKKSSKESKSRKPKGLNITLNVPEERLESLNTTDILDRIINCSDRDVDIDTLRELRSQILGELKQTGSNEDISDLILKSYKKENKTETKKNNEVEEGELSDSESEAIENIYGSLVVTDKDKNQSKQKPALDKRKIQIRLVISDKDEDKPVQEIDNFDLTQGDEIEENSKNKDIISLDSDESSSHTNKVQAKRNLNTVNKGLKAKPSTKSDIITIDDDDKISKKAASDIDDPIIICEDSPISIKPPLKVGSPAKINQPPPKVTNPDNFDFLPTLKQLEQSDKKSKVSAPTKNVANFYKPINEEDKEKSNLADKTNNKESDPTITKQPDSSTIVIEDDTAAKPSEVPENKPSELPENKPSQSPVDSTDAAKTPVADESISSSSKSKEVSEIDILQALKNEILNETIPIATPEADTPALHQPKLTKVSSAKEILPKKRISIENYKKKSTTTSTAKQLFVKESQDARDKKQSLKLTEKEYERFKLPARLSLDEEQFSDDDLLDDPRSPTDDIYSDLAPESPDNEVITSSVGAPVIIPTDPVKTVAATSNIDVDMRTTLPPLPVPPPAIMPLVSPILDGPLIDLNKTRAVIDPRMRKDTGPPKASPNPFIVNPEIIPGPPLFPNIPPLMPPSYTPSFTPNMTPRQMTPNSRSFEMTPSHSPFEVDELMTRKHVYAPTFSAFDREASVPRDSSYRDNMSQSCSNDDRRRDDRAWDDRNVRATSIHRDSSRYRYDKYQDQRPDRYQDARHDQYGDLRRDKYPDSRSDKYREQRYDKYQDPRRDKYGEMRNDKYYVDRREYSKADGPMTPSFGWSECPSTPSSSFGRSECPTTPIHPFGRSDCPTTPSHPFGRSECPTTPSHPFGRSDCPTTPSHPFGRSDCPATPNHPFGRSEAPKPANPLLRKDPRLNRRTEVESRPQSNDRERGFQGDRQYGRGSFNNSNYSTPESYERDQNSGNKSRYYDRERRDRSISRDTENDRFKLKTYSNMSYEDVGSRRSNYEQHAFGRSAHDDKSRNYRAASVGRRTSDASDSDNRLSVKSRSGRSFVIDTSVNSSFQKLIESKGIEVFDYSFSSRRQRAASVGRSLCRENSVGRQMPRSLPRKDETKVDRMKRASSVGRDLSSDKNKSLRDLKAEFEAFKATIHLKVPSTRDTRQEPNYRNSRMDNFQQRGRKSGSKPKPSYSPRKNYRDPRMRHDQRDTHNKSRSGSDSRDRYRSGIVYSNDNIAKGTIIGTGFGVRNYKIPKIKRPEPEPEPILEPKPIPPPEVSKNEKPIQKKPVKSTVKKEKKPEKMVQKDQDKANQSANDAPKVTETIEDSSKRLTRSSKKVEIGPKQEEVAPKGRRTKKGVIYDSESDSDKDIINKPQNTSKKVVSPKKVKSKAKIETTETPNEKPEKDTDSISQSSFVIDDMSLFPDNIVSDPVIDNINALIADLDHDLDEKSVSPTALEKMMDSIDSPEDSFGDISEVIQNDLNETEKLKSSDANNEDKQSSNAMFDELKKESAQEKSNTTLKKDVSDVERTQNREQNSSVLNNENIVSTTDSHLVDLKANEDSNDSNFNKGTNADQNVPDSTINKTKSTYKPEEGLPDSTNEISNQASAIVTSTDDSEMGKKGELSETSSSRKEVSQMRDSLDNLLYMLQNKSKLKEMLSMLGDQSGDSEKIKKKLEKLSEIVSDDEESNDALCHTDTSNIGAPEIQKPEENVSESIKMDSDHSKEDPHKIELKADKEINKTSAAPNIDDLTATSSTKDILQSVPQNLDIETESKTKAETDDLESLKSKEITDAEDNNKLNDVTSDIQNDSKPKEIASGEEGNIEEEQTKTTLDDTTDNKSIKKSDKQIRKVKGKMKAKKIPIKTQQESSTSAAANKPGVNRRRIRGRELKQLQDDLKEMFISDDVLNATGIRMCRIAKLVEDKNENIREDSTVPDEVQTPVVVIEKFKINNTNEMPIKIRKKPGPKPKPKKENVSIENLDKTDNKIDKSKDAPKNKPGPKSRKRKQSDPYEFDTDSLADTSTTKDSENDSESDDVSLASSSQSFGSSEVLADLKKKPKRKRRRWQVGIIRAKNRKKKEQKTDIEELPPKPVTIPDYNCFTDKTYCFKKNISTYSCRLCHYTGDEIVRHYKKQHPHTEIPLSRIEQSVAKAAIEQSEKLSFLVIGKMSSDKYTCRFCFKEFNARGNALETFFWHIVSTHTGEYKQTCYECVTETRCPFHLDIPPPPKELQKQLIGHICSSCNYIQLSVENIKSHVIIRHNDEETEVYRINLSEMSKKAIASILKRSQHSAQPRVLRSNRSKESTTELSDDASYKTESEQNEEVSIESHIDVPIQSHVKSDDTSKPFKSTLYFESDDVHVEADIKIERLDNEGDEITNYDEGNEPQTEAEPETLPAKSRYNTDNIMDCAHFRVHFTETGKKEYICCINDSMHYKDKLLISMKRHIQSKHSNDNWDGYCTLCKVIVTLQGVKSNFNDCLDHYLSKHSDDFPVAETLLFEESAAPAPAPTPPPKPYLTVRPLAELIAKELNKPEIEKPPALPVIETVVSLGDPNVPVPSSVPAIVDTSLSTPRTATPPIGVPPLTVARMSPATTPIPALSPIQARVATPPVVPTYPVSVTEVVKPKPFEYEEVQADVMSKKYRIVLDDMMAKNVLVRVFKCAGRYCSYTCDSAEDSLFHATAHHRVGGEDALRCAYCNFDTSGNPIDLVMHVFKEHSRCEYCCGLCFYRAASVQHVVEHFGKMHRSSGTTLTVLRNATLSPQPPDNRDILTREQAVPYYVCKINDSACKFRSYIPGKFCEHAAQKHPTATSHPCYVCETIFPSCPELVDHMKGHGLRLYQCTWCVFGSSDDSGLISHVASVHPNKLPQAYLRIITVKDGTNDMRVLPLVNLNKSKVIPYDIRPSYVKEDPVKVAERSIDLEKLIGQANALANVITEPSTPVGTILPEPNPEPPKTSMQENPLPKDSESPTIPIKPEPQEKDNTFDSNTVICLDSDEEVEPEKLPQNTLETAPTPSALSPSTTTKDAVPKYNMIPDVVLLKCPYCSGSYKSKMGLTKHFRTCKLKHNDIIICPHSPCTKVIENLSALYQHYENDHSLLKSPNKCFACQICNMKFEQHSHVKTHFKAKHGIDKYVMHAKLQDDGSCLFAVSPVMNDGPKAVRRKSSTETPKKGTEPQKRYQPDTPKKYGINDIDKLPITPILDSLVYCDLCEFSTKVRLNMIRHLQLHAENQSVPQTEPVNPVPHLETNEKHFDKMVNLASSSVVTRAPEKTKDRDGTPTVTLLIPPQAAAQYPKYVPERQRHTCGAKGCTYISVDEAMLRCHWDTLHAGTTDYHCVHCPPHQHLDTSKPLTAAHIVAHLKMHDMTLYACSSCTYYHYKKQAVEKHLSEQHRGGQVMVVREEYVPPPPVPSPSTVAPTMDLKPWQCGLCEFKSMLRPEVVNHCGKNHQSKMQFKCGYCPFRTSTIENVSKHQSNSHPGKPEDIFYYFYKESSIPNDDGVPLWQKQTQKTSTEVKSEPEPEPRPQEAQPSVPPTPVVEVNLNLVKKEVEETPSDQILSIEDLCKKYGEFCPPNGIKYRCCLCSVVMEHTREDMQSHLFEELSYRRWSCAACPYKAYHRAGLNEHMASHPARQYLEPTQLPIDHNIEKWVQAFLDHQQTIIEKNKENFAKQKIVMEKPAPVVRHVVEAPKSRTCSNEELEQVFGSFGAPVNGLFCCPKCNWQVNDETEMRNHLESELTKIRWCCTNCALKFQTYHEAQFHCKSHTGQPARPVEAIRDPAVRSSWVTEVIKSQKKSKITPEPSTSEKNDTEENSLLVELYAETANLDEHGLVMRKRLAESDEEASKNSGPPTKKMNDRSCPYCNYKCKFPAQIREHVLKHYNLKPFTCGHCDFVSYRKGVLIHMESQHSGMPRHVRPTKIPDISPSEYILKPTKNLEKIEEVSKVCLICEKQFTNQESETHMHGVEKPDFCPVGDRVIKCNICGVLKPNMARLQEHFKISHPYLSLNYSYYALQLSVRFKLQCDHCSLKFQTTSDIRTHHLASHGSLAFKYSSVPYTATQSEGLKRKLDESSPKRVAKKSTTKLPYRTVAKKSTTKLPYFYSSDSEEEEYSYYGTKPEPFTSFKNITTKMPMFNTVVDIDVHKFSTLLNIDPKVVLSDVNKNKK